MAKAPDIEEHHIAADSLHMHKGEEVILVDDGSALTQARIGLGWHAPEQNDGYPVDIDACAFLLGREGRVRRDTDFIFYNNLETENGAVVHCGDSKTGTGEGDDEVLRINLDKIPFDVEMIAFSVTIHNAEERQQNFGLIKDAFIRIVNEATGHELAHFDLTEDASSDNAMVFGELIREGAGWKFRAIGDGSAGGLYKIARDFGVNVAPN